MIASGLPNLELYRETKQIETWNWGWIGFFIPGFNSPLMAAECQMGRYDFSALSFIIIYD